MKQIKTIKNRLDSANTFDLEVNAAIAEGWRLTKREVLQPKAQSESMCTHIMLYAELERDIITKAERCCDNCKWFEQQPESEPCCSCEGDIINPTKWEEA